LSVFCAEEGKEKGREREEEEGKGEERKGMEGMFNCCAFCGRILAVPLFVPVAWRMSAPPK